MVSENLPFMKAMVSTKKVTRNTSTEKYLLFQPLTCNSAENFWRISKEGVESIKYTGAILISQIATLLKEGLYHGCASWETFEDVQNSWNLGRLLLTFCKAIVGSHLRWMKVVLIYNLDLIYSYLLIFGKVIRAAYLFKLIKMTEHISSFQKSCVSW